MQMLKLSQMLKLLARNMTFIPEASLKSPRYEGYEKYEKRN